MARKDTYSHMLGCLNVEPGAVERIKESAESARTENGKRVAHLCAAILDGDRFVTCLECETECGQNAPSFRVLTDQ